MSHLARLKTDISLINGKKYHNGDIFEVYNSALNIGSRPAYILIVDKYHDLIVFNTEIDLIYEETFPRKVIDFFYNLWYNKLILKKKDGKKNE